MPAPSRSAADALRPLLATPAAAEFVRFVVAGVGVTLFSAAIYAALAVSLRESALLANAFSHGCGIVAGYYLHSRWSFRGSHHDAGAAIRFALGSGVGFGLNSAWVWLAVTAAHLPAWAPIPAMVFVTPLASFALNRCWVFARAG